ncbi:MAG TPA: macrocin O-methyltransferase [Acinetobacter lwoffii]|nr:macrocin O-methyltransferase [Acinetobacter lwoffii]
MIIKTNATHNYLELLKKSILNELYIENEARIILTLSAIINNTKLSLQDLFNIREHESLLDNLEANKQNGSYLIIRKKNELGALESIYLSRNFTELSHTMIGKKRLNNIQYCVETVLNEDIPGDLIETGIWRGGATIFMRGILAAYEVTDRMVWAADSFEGVPAPSLPEDAELDISANVFPVLAVSLDEVCDLFERYDLLDEQVNFIQGWFKDTLATAPIESLSVLRLDGDLYESTMDALYPLYPKVSTGGFIIVDDYYSCPPCKLAIDEYRKKYAIVDELIQIDDQSVYWRKS